MPTSAPNAVPAGGARSTALGFLLLLTFLNSVGTSILWNGMSFVLKHQFHYPEWKTLLAYVAMAVVYVVAAAAAGPILARSRGRLSARGLMGIAFAVEASPALVVPWAGAEVALMYAAVAASIAGALLWPVMEAYVAGGKHGHAMRRSIGIWCIAWMSAVTIALACMGPLFLLDDVARVTVWAIAASGAASLLLLPTVAPDPQPHPADSEPVPAAYPPLLRSARVILPVSYVLVSSLSALLPYVLSAHGLDESWQTPLAATWLAVRTLAALALVFTHRWHGRWGALLGAGVALAGGFALVATGPSLTLVVIGLAAFGIGHALAYYAALYYAMRVGSAGVEAGGTHEALIGAGYIAGPLAAAGGVALGGSAGLVGAVLGLCCIASIPAVRPFLSHRAGRSAPSPR